jgi:hypothetical protein
MKHYQTRIAFAEKEIKRWARTLYIVTDTLPAGQLANLKPLHKLNQANRIRKHYIAKNYEYVRARMKDKSEYYHINVPPQPTNTRPLTEEEIKTGEVKINLHK